MPSSKVTSAGASIGPSVGGLNVNQEAALSTLDSPYWPVTLKTTLSTCEAAWLTRLRICVPRVAVPAPWTTALPPVYAASAAWHGGIGRAGLPKVLFGWYVTNERLVWAALSPASTEAVVRAPTSPY